MSVKPP